MGLEISAVHVRRSALIEADPQRVWQEFESSPKISAWLNQGHVLHRLEPEPGGAVDFSVDIDGTEVHFGGRVVVLEPGRELSMAINWESEEMAWPVDLYWTFRLTSHPLGTLVELFHHGFDVLGDTAAQEVEGYEAGWSNNHLTTLREIVLGS